MLTGFVKPSRPPTPAWAEHKTLCFHIPELHPHYLRWLSHYSLAREHWVLLFLKGNVAWGLTLLLFGGSRGWSRRSSWGRDCWRRAGPCLAPAKMALCPSSCVCFKVASLRSKAGIFGLCSWLQTLKSTKAKPAHFNKRALMWGARLLPAPGLFRKHLHVNTIMPP